MSFPHNRLRRLRRSAALRDMVRETTVQVEKLMAPLFIVPGTNFTKEISSMPGQYQMSIDTAVEKASQLFDMGIRSTILFAIPEHKDDIGSSAWQEDGIIPNAISAIKRQVPEMVVTTDLCFCEYTSHGHCGVMKDGHLENDHTLENLVRQARVHAESGADIIAPSGMLDGMVGALRHGLDECGFENLPIMSYAAKFSSAFYGPFREAVESAPEYGDRKSYQMDVSNGAEALREVALDIEEGADIIMVKPALSFLDVIREVKATFNVPTAAYNVSGEYAMVMAAAQKGWLDQHKVMVEVLTSITRAGADIIITYFAEAFADMRRKGLV
jgi:porphobilinogen synthase